MIPKKIYQIIFINIHFAFYFTLHPLFSENIAAYRYNIEYLRENDDEMETLFDIQLCKFSLF